MARMPAACRAADVRPSAAITSGARSSVPSSNTSRAWAPHSKSACCQAPAAGFCAEGTRKNGIVDVISKGALANFLGVERAVGGAKQPPRVVDELQRAQRLRRLRACIPNAELSQECNRLVEESRTPPLGCLCRRGFGGVGEDGFQTDGVESQRSRKSNGPSPGDNNVRTNRLSHGGPLKAVLTASPKNRPGRFVSACSHPPGAQGPRSIPSVGEITKKFSASFLFFSRSATSMRVSSPCASVMIHCFRLISALLKNRRIRPELSPFFSATLKTTSWPLEIEFAALPPVVRIGSHEAALQLCQLVKVIVDLGHDLSERSTARWFPASCSGRAAP